ncbi:HAD-IIB family hydrolase [Rarobacter incanus]|uniref:HAD superfamily hydrolase (TIGR01484 family) n=1 Tax=Rarobacter incanus TaxID=153494 RepID=A0A542SQ71_9MICO|nr:HAD-IIB family hydrolase [Rarobacter incanus]TQK76735.1 hypothetical protein FB389_1425 [Rarobacter incanus]
MATTSPAVRLFASDVDGTLLTSNHRLTGEVRAAISRARSAGVHVVLASARSALALARIQAQLDLVGEPVVALQGAWVGTVSATGSLTAFARHPIDLSAALAVYEQCERIGTPMSWFTETDWFYSRPAAVVDYEARVTGIAASGQFDADLAVTAPLKIMVPPNPAMPDSGRQVLEALPATLHGQLTGENYLEITARAADKSHGIALVADQLGVGSEQIAAAGDGQNDIGMFRLAARSFAMGNASPIVQGAAGEVVPTNEDSGLAVAIVRALG